MKIKGITDLVILVQEAYRSNQYAFFDDGDFNLNFFGVRQLATWDNAFSDTLGCVLKMGGEWRVYLWQGTVDPGAYYIHEQLGNPRGTAKVVAGQYRRLWTFGMHRNAYRALVQIPESPVKVYRLGLEDGGVPNENTKTQSGYFGINLHRANASGSSSPRVDRWSAGCQVFASNATFQEALWLAKQQVDIRGWNTFTYTLFTARDEPKGPVNPELAELLNWTPGLERYAYATCS